MSQNATSEPRVVGLAETELQTTMQACDEAPVWRAWGIDVKARLLRL